MAILDEVLQTLEIQPTGIPTVVRLSQNENGRQIRLTLRGNEDDFPAGCLVTIAGTKPDGVVYSATGELDGNVAVINEDTQMTAVPGMWKARVQVTYGGSTIATELIVFEIYADPVDPESVPSESELTGLVAEAQYWAENARSSAYGSPLTASTAAEMTETDRVYVYTGSESGWSNGHWYYYDGTAWADGGIYNAAAVQTDTTLSVSGMAADAKATGDAIAAEAARATAAETAIAADVATAQGDISDVETDLAGVHTSISGIEDTLAAKADTDGNYPDLTAGAASALLSDSYTEDTAPYKYRRTPYASKRLSDEIVGGSVVFNQLFNAAQIPTFTVRGVTFTNNDDGSFTLNGTAEAQAVSSDVTISDAANHVFYYAGNYTQLRQNGSNLALNAGTPILVRNTSAPVTMRFRVVGGETLTNYVTTPQAIDLTALFGAAIADYLYNLEQTTAGAGVAFFRNLFPDAYYVYNAGELVSISGLSEHKTIGKNLFSGQYVSGSINATGGVYSYASTDSRVAIIPCQPNTTYTTKKFETSSRFIICTANRYPQVGDVLTNYFNSTSNSCTFTTDGDAQYIVIGVTTSSEKQEPMMQVEMGSVATAYEPYGSHTYPLDSTLTLRGIPKLDSNNKLYFDGDRYASDGTVTRRYGIVDLGTLTWTYSGVIFYSSSEPAFGSGGLAKYQGSLFCGKYVTRIVPTSNPTDKSIYVSNSAAAPILRVADSDYTDAATFKSAMSGVMLVYELATPTTETAEPYQEIQICDPDGTEEYVSTTVVPVGHESKYYKDIIAAIEGIPDAPAANGVYTLKCTVTDGVPVYSWE